MIIGRGKEMELLKRMSQDDVSHFCRKFDYRFQKEPWGNARDAVERSIRFLTGEGEFWEKNSTAEEE